MSVSRDAGHGGEDFMDHSLQEGLLQMTPSFHNCEKLISVVYKSVHL